MQCFEGQGLKRYNQTSNGEPCICLDASMFVLPVADASLPVGDDMMESLAVYYAWLRVPSRTLGQREEFVAF